MTQEIHLVIYNYFISLERRSDGVKLDQEIRPSAVVTYEPKKYKSQSKTGRLKKASKSGRKDLVVNTKNEPYVHDNMKIGTASELTQRFRK